MASLTPSETKRLNFSLFTADDILFHFRRIFNSPDPDTYLRQRRNDFAEVEASTLPMRTLLMERIAEDIQRVEIWKEALDLRQSLEPADEVELAKRNDEQLLSDDFLEYARGFLLRLQDSDIGREEKVTIMDEKPSDTRDVTGEAYDPMSVEQTKSIVKTERRMPSGRTPRIYLEVPERRSVKKNVGGAAVPPGAGVALPALCTEANAMLSGTNAGMPPGEDADAGMPPDEDVDAGVPPGEDADAGIRPRSLSPNSNTFVVTDRDGKTVRCVPLSIPDLRDRQKSESSVSHVSTPVCAEGPVDDILSFPKEVTSFVEQGSSQKRPRPAAGVSIDDFVIRQVESTSGGKVAVLKQGRAKRALCGGLWEEFCNFKRRTSVQRTLSWARQHSVWVRLKPDLNEVDLRTFADSPVPDVVVVPNAALDTIPYTVRDRVSDGFYISLLQLAVPDAKSLKQNVFWLRFQYQPPDFSGVLLHGAAIGGHTLKDFEDFFRSSFRGKRASRTSVEGLAHIRHIRHFFAILALATSYNRRFFLQSEMKPMPLGMSSYFQYRLHATRYNTTTGRKQAEFNLRLLQDVYNSSKKAKTQAELMQAREKHFHSLEDDVRRSFALAEQRLEHDLMLTRLANRDLMEENARLRTRNERLQDDNAQLRATLTEINRLVAKLRFALCKDTEETPQEALCRVRLGLSYIPEQQGKPKGDKFSRASERLSEVAAVEKFVTGEVTTVEKRSIHSRTREEDFAARQFTRRLNSMTRENFSDRIKAWRKAVEDILTDKDICRFDPSLPPPPALPQPSEHQKEDEESGSTLNFSDLFDDSE